jgi:N-acetylglutamate synthase-like GNAT family acetyltransferase
MEGMKVTATERLGEVAYRKASEADWPAIREVLATANFDRVPSPEMPDFDLSRAFVAEHEGTLVGVAGYKLDGPGRGKTTLMAVLPGRRGLGIGQELHELRLMAMQRQGCTTAITNADLPETIAWYERKFGYRAVGSVPKVHEFGAVDIDEWTTIEVDVERWLAGLSAPRLEELSTAADALGE